MFYRLMTVMLSSGPDISGGRNWLQTDGIYVLGVAAAFYVTKEWKQSNWGKIVSVLLVYVILFSLFKGDDVARFFAGLLRWLGFETGVK